MLHTHSKHLRRTNKLFTITIILALIAVQLLAIAVSQANAAPGGVAPKTPRLTTPWTAAATAAIANPLPEYPRPQMMRSNWQSLNGEWQWQSATSITTPPTGQTLSSRINVPYPVESALSGVMQNVHYMWYRRTFTIPSGWAGQQVLINFGAVDWRSVVYINGTLKGTHEGGYDAFTYNITGQLNGGTNEIIVGVYDPTDGDGVNQPMGKQRNAPGGIMYTGASGIWQTVWLEPVPTASISRLDMTPNIDNATLNVVVQGTAGQTATVTAFLPGTTTVVGSGSGATGANISVPVPSPHLWSPSDPYLYDLTVSLNGGDIVTSYFGMRKISTGMVNGKLRPLLNNQFLFQMGTLDQGYWPDGIYTAPTDAALRFDLEQQKAMGYNMVRKHIKIEPQRWFYWADKLGILVWQDMPTMPNPPTAAQQSRHTAEFQEVVNEHRSSPALIMWVDHNEGWGQYNQAGLATTVKGWDPSRLVNNMSGINCCGAVDGGNGDVADWHCYLGPCSPVPSASRIAVMGEYGGLGLKVAGHEWDAPNSHSYVLESSVANLVSHYVSIVQQAEGLVSNPGLSAAVYTEPVDVETEVNGWYTYDRVLKISNADVTTIRNANLALIAAANNTYTQIVPTSETTAQSWRYTTAAPASNWNTTGFSDSAWSTGNGGFGTAGTPGAIIGTTWSTADIWLRRTFNPGSLTATQISNLMFRLHHDEDAELYINGVLALTATGYIGNYVYMPMTTAGQNAVIQNGNNVLAVHVHQTTGGQFIDSGIFVKVTAPVGQSPYSGTPWSVPGTIQAENFDLGGEGVAYHDLEPANQSGQYRTADGVDIEATTDTGGGFNVDYTASGDWMEYTINVPSAGNYTLTERVASAGATQSFRVEFNGVDKTGAVAIPNTGGWQTWVNLSQTVNLSAGVQVMRLYFLGNDGNVNYLSLSATGGSTPTPTRTNTPGPTVTPTRTPTPGPVGVIFYQDINYGGVASGIKAKGDYAVLPSDVPNDWMSSLRVPVGWIVDAYADGNFAGAVCTYTADTSWVGTGCNDVMSSFRIR